MKKNADLKRNEQQYQVGDWVYLRLQPYCQASIQQRKNLKLSPRYYGPFQAEQKIGEVAYRTQLPPTTQIHNVFHVSQLKKQLGQKVSPLPTLPLVDSRGVFKPEPDKILTRRMKKMKNIPVVELLVLWQGQPMEEASWEPYHHLCEAFPHLVRKVF